MDKNRKDRTCKCKNEREKVRKNNARINGEKSERSDKLHTSIRRAKVCLYQENMT